jgi:hypothetical protein
MNKYLKMATLSFIGLIYFSCFLNAQDVAQNVQVSTCEGTYGHCMPVKYLKKTWHCVDNDGHPETPDKYYHIDGCFPSSPSKDIDE